MTAAARAPSAPRAHLSRRKGGERSDRGGRSGAQQQRAPAYAAIKPMRRVPALALDDGAVIAESVAICRCFEALYPDPPLFGHGALESALVEMWNRRAELHFLFPVAMVFQHLHPAMKVIVDPQLPAWGEANKPRIFRLPALARRRTETPRAYRGRAFHHRRQHRARRGRLHESVKARRARRIVSRTALVRRRLRPPRAPRRNLPCFRGASRRTNSDRRGGTGLLRGVLSRTGHFGLDPLAQ
jgi:hypothetical protein